jgi:DNA-3-methyladenine glycosylase II
VTDGWLYRVVGDTAYRARQEGPEMVVEGEGDLTAAVEDIRWRLAESLPREPLFRLAESDEIVRALIQRFPGHRPPFVVDPFESLITSVTAQQVNLTWALTTRRRLVEQYGSRYELDGVEVYEFPSPDAIAVADPAEIRAMQFTTRKAEYIVSIARAAADGWLDGVTEMGDEEAVHHLVQMRGVGRWTAEWLLARCLGRPNIIPAGDLGVRKAVSFSYRTSDHILDEGIVRDIAEPWGDATNLTVHLLLETLA